MPDDRAIKQNYLYDDQEGMVGYCRPAIERKQQLYWLGFLAGARSSGRIEIGEPAAIQAEATRFATFFECPDARDLYEDIAAGCFASGDDLLETLDSLLETKRVELAAEQPFEPVDDLNEFLGFCAGIICDGQVLQEEVAAILRRFEASEPLIHEPAFADLRAAVHASMSDGVVTVEESAEIQEWLARLVGDGFADTGIANIGNVTQVVDTISDPGRVSFEGRRFALTGPMRMGTRSSIVRRLEAIGGVFDPSPTKKTDYVVVASEASPMWRTTHYGRKISKATALIDSGAKVRFINETTFELAIASADGEGMD